MMLSIKECTNYWMRKITDYRIGGKLFYGYAMFYENTEEKLESWGKSSVKRL